MTIELTIPPEWEEKVQKYAELTGMSVDRFVLSLVRAGLQFTDTMETAAEEQVDDGIPPEERAARFRDWAKSASRSVGYVDDSRESIYEDRA